MSVYTKTGDKGETGLYSSDRKKIIRVRKDSVVIQTIGAIDELNSFLGMVCAKLKNKTYKKNLQNIQHNLFTIGAILAGSKLEFLDLETRQLEKQIDIWESKLPVLKNFILPGGNENAALIFYARALTRKAERQLVILAKKQDFSFEILRYINRLSDYLFVFARQINKNKNIKEKIWKQ